MSEMIFETKEDQNWAPSTRSTKHLIEADPEFTQELSQIPDKMAFKIGEVADIVGVKTYVLRYWQTEFSALRPRKSKNNQRIYLKKDVELALMIRKLLYKDRFSIEGARTALKKMKKETKKSKAIHGAISRIEGLKEDIQDLVFEIEKIQKRLI